MTEQRNLTELPKSMILNVLLAQATQAKRSFVVPGKYSGDGLSITWKFSGKQGKFGYFLTKMTKVW